MSAGHFYGYPLRRILCGLLIVCAAVAFTSAAERRSARQAKADQLVRQALEAELADDNARRAKLLGEALKLDEDNEPAHWQSAHVERNGKWLALKDAQRLAAEDPKILKYEALQQTLAYEYVGYEQHVALAQLCKKHGLEVREKYHWWKALELRPESPAALEGLQATWFQGTLVPRDQLPSIKRELRRLRAAQRSWKSKLSRWADDINHRETRQRAAEAALKEFAAIDDPEAIVHILHVISEEGGEFATAAIPVLGRFVEHDATLALLRIAVFAPDEDLREAATSQLARRPLHDYAHQLIRAMEKPLESSFTIHVSRIGHVTYTHQVFQEGPDANLTRRHDQSYVQGGFALVPNGGTSIAPDIAPFNRRKHAVALQYRQEASRFEESVAAANERQELLNQRIRTVLATVVGERTGPLVEVVATVQRSAHTCRKAGILRLYLSVLLVR